jgi:hypothetical protein
MNYGEQGTDLTLRCRLSIMRSRGHCEHNTSIPTYELGQFFHKGVVSNRRV